VTLIRKSRARKRIVIYIGFLDCLASFPLSCVRAVTVFAPGFWHDHNSLTSLILNKESQFIRRENAVAGHRI
jgi:hypothetical protein